MGNLSEVMERKNNDETHQTKVSVADTKGSSKKIKPCRPCSLRPGLGLFDFQKCLLGQEFFFAFRT